MPRRAFRPAPLPELIVSDAKKLSVCVRDLARSTVIGFDTEFVGEDSYQPELCLIQVSTADRLYIIDPFASPARSTAFWALMHDPARVVLAHAAREESAALPVRLRARCRPTCSTRRSPSACSGHTYPISYAGLVQETLGVRLNKGDTLSDWRRRPLSDSQLRYAFDDVRYLIPAYDLIHAQVEEAGPPRNGRPRSSPRPSSGQSAATTARSSGGGR